MVSHLPLLQKTYVLKLHAHRYLEPTILPVAVFGMEVYRVKLRPLFSGMTKILLNYCARERRSEFEV
jgi:hypothetical protein